jgi:glycogen operon protein
VSYNQKHNLANQEDNRDGNNDNNGWNCGVEGETDDPHVLLLRRRVAQALLATLLLAQGTPMLLAGDEQGHSQQGNNNAYCQDNEITWLDWSKADAELGDYVARVLAIRKRIPALAANRWWSTLPDANGVVDVDWFNPSGARLEAHDWEDPSAKALMVQLSGDWLILVNGSSNQINFRLPVGEWRLELCSTEDANAGFSGDGCIVAARSVTVLARKPAEAAELAVSPV